MINSVELRNFGPIAGFHWQNLGKINLVIGVNDKGKTFVLKALYSAMRTLEEYQRGNDPRSAATILAEKLHWTFQVEKIGDLVSKGAEAPLSFRLVLDQRSFSYEFGRDTTKSITTLINNVPPRNSNSIFLPAKEVLSLYHIILKSREQDKVFGFDDTYLDLAQALRQSPTRGRNFASFANSRRSLENILGGKVEYDETAGRWQFKKGNHIANIRWIKYTAVLQPIKNASKK